MDWVFVRKRVGSCDDELLQGFIPRKYLGDADTRSPVPSAKPDSEAATADAAASDSFSQGRSAEHPEGPQRRWPRQRTPWPQQW